MCKPTVCVQIENWFHGMTCLRHEHDRLTFFSLEQTNEIRRASVKLSIRSLILASIVPRLRVKSAIIAFRSLIQHILAPAELCYKHVIRIFSRGGGIPFRSGQPVLRRGSSRRTMRANCWFTDGCTACCDPDENRFFFLSAGVRRSH